LLTRRIGPLGAQAICETLHLRHPESETMILFRSKMSTFF
jgi:hypothetical protein